MKIITIAASVIILLFAGIFLYISLTTLGKLTHQLQITTSQPTFIITQVKEAQSNVKEMHIYSNELSLNRNKIFINDINIKLKQLYLETENIYEMLKGVYQGPVSDIQQFKSILDEIKSRQDKLIIYASDTTHSEAQIAALISTSLQVYYDGFSAIIEKILSYEQTSLAALSVDSGNIFNMTALIIVMLSIAIIVTLIIFYLIKRKTSLSIEKANTQLNEALKKANLATNAKSEFLARMSHDIRTPLNGIIGMNYIAQQHLDDKEALTDALLKTQTSAEYLLKLLNDILDMTKIESGKMSLSHAPFDMNEMLSSVIQMEQSAAYQKHQTLSISLPPKFTVTFIGDRLRLSQILMNLLSNAIKFTPDKGTISLDVKAQPIIDEKMTITFTIADTGIGISDEMKARLFKPFEQEDAYITSQYGGSGLGLAIVKMLITMMNGNITVASEKDKGSVFTVVLPIQVVDSTEVHDSTQSSFNKINPLLFKGYKALILEDNQINQEILIEILQMFGMESDTANDGKEGLEKFKTSAPKTYDIIFSDIRMPNMDGYEFAKAARSSLHPQAKTIPIIAMSANAFEDDVKMSLECGMNDHLCKPVDVQNLVSTVSKYIVPKTAMDLS